MPPSQRPIQNSLNSGELSPRLRARDDFERYQNGVEKMRNWIPLPHGGAHTRSGTVFVSEVKSSSKETILIPFEYSTIESYIIEAGDLYFRFYRDGGRIESSPGTPVEIATPYAEADLPDVRWVQSSNILYLVHPSYQPRKLIRNSDTSWTLTIIDFVDGPYQDQNKDTTKTIAPSATSGSVTLTASGHSPFSASDATNGRLVRIQQTNWGYAKITGYTSPTVVTATVINAFDNTTASSKWRLGAFSSTTGYPRALTIMEQRLTFGGTSADPDSGWMSTTGSYEDFSPSSIAGTVADSDAISFRLGSQKVNAILWMLGGRNLLIGTRGEEYHVGAANDNVALTPSNRFAHTSSAFGSKAASPVKNGSSVVYFSRGGRKVRNMEFDAASDQYKSPDLTIFAEHLARRPRSFKWMAYQQEPDYTLWIIRDDGYLASMTFLPVEKVLAWALHDTDGLYRHVAVIPTSDDLEDQAWFVVQRTIGGATKRYIEYSDADYNVDAGLKYDGTVSTATLTPGATTGNGVTFTASASVFAAGDVGKDLLLLGYTVGGVKYYSRAAIATYVSPTQVTANITTDFPNTSPVAAGSWARALGTVSGLSHLEGKTVKIVGDGAVYDDGVVSSGSVSLTNGPKAAIIYVGLSRPRTYIKTLEPYYRDERGTIRGRQKHWATVEVDIEDTMGLDVNGKELQYRLPSDPMDVALATFTGRKVVANLGVSPSGQLEFEQKQPLPATLNAYYGELSFGD